MPGESSTTKGAQVPVRQTNFVVTGANGYLGRNICAALLDRGNNVVALSRSDFSKLPESELLTKISFDLGRDNPETLGVALNDSVLIDTAWSNGFNHWDSSHLEQASDHLKFLNTSANLGVRKIVGIGSMHEIGRLEGVFHEGDALTPQNIYGISKLALLQGQMQISSKHRIPSLWLRCFYFEGQDGENNSILTKVLRASEMPDASLAFDSGLSRFDFIDVRLAGQIIASLAADPAISGEMNIGSGFQTSIRDKVMEFVKTNDLQVKITFEESTEMQPPAVGCWPDVSRLRAHSTMHQ